MTGFKVGTGPQFTMGYRGDGMRMWKMKSGAIQPPGGNGLLGGGALLDPGMMHQGRWVYKYDGQMMVQDTYQPNQSAPLQRTQYVPGMRGVECSMDNSNHVNWFVYDAHGNVLMTIDGNQPGQTWGTARNARSFDVWGSPRGQFQTPSNVPKHGYCGNLGHTVDTDLGGLIYMRARYYERDSKVADTAVGRLVERGRRRAHPLLDL
jgi:hypothetical protein